MTLSPGKTNAAQTRLGLPRSLISQQPDRETDAAAQGSNACVQFQQVSVFFLFRIITLTLAANATGNCLPGPFKPLFREEAEVLRLGETLAR